jgi:hypothetical protein
LIRSSSIHGFLRAARLVSCLLLGLVLTGASCENNKAGRVGGPSEVTVSFKRLLVLPFERSEGIICPLCRRSVLACQIEPEAESSLNKLLMEGLREYRGFEIVSQEEVNRAVLDVPEPERTKLQVSPDFALRVAGKVKADAVLRNFVFCYRERKGNAAAASMPAAVSFHLHLYDAGSGELEWAGVFEEEQEALSENLLTLPDFLRRGGKWIKVDELAAEGMARALSGFPAPLKVDE